MNSNPQQQVIPAQPQVVGAAAILQVIQAGAANPAVDIDKMERLVAMYERMTAREAEAAFNDALADCQREIRTIGADATNPQTRSEYATYAKLDGKLRPIYTSRGFSLSYNTIDSPKAEHVRVLAYLARGGHTRTYTVDMPADGKGAKGGDVMTKTHAAGAAMSYGMRYLLKGIFNVAVGEEDTDGNTPKGMSHEDEDALVLKIENTTTKAKAQEVWKEAIEACKAAGDVGAANRIKAKLQAHLKFIEEANK